MAVRKQWRVVRDYDGWYNVQWLLTRGDATNPYDWSTFARYPFRRWAIRNARRRQERAEASAAPSVVWTAEEEGRGG